MMRANANFQLYIKLFLLLEEKTVLEKAWSGSVLTTTVIRSRKIILLHQERNLEMRFTPCLSFNSDIRMVRIRRKLEFKCGRTMGFFLSSKLKHWKGKQWFGSNFQIPYIIETSTFLTYFSKEGQCNWRVRFRVRFSYVTVLTLLHQN